MAGEWAYLVSGAAQARTAAPTPPIGRSQILAIRRQVGKVSLVCLLSQFGHESDIRHRRGDSSKSDEQWQPILFLRRGPLLPDGSVFSLPSFGNDRFQLPSEHRGERHGSGIGEIDQADDSTASIAGNGAARRQHASMRWSSAANSRGASPSRPVASSGTWRKSKPGWPHADQPPSRARNLLMSGNGDRARFDSAGSGSSSGIEGGMSTGTRFLPATQASMMSDHSCIIWRR